MSIAHSIMLLVTLLFVLTTRGVRLDFHTPTKNPTRAEFSSPISSPHLKREDSTFLSPRRLSETERVPYPADEIGKPRRNWRSLTRSRESSQSAPVSPPSLTRPWNTPPASSLRRYHGESDGEDVQNSDGEYADHLVASKQLGTRSMDNLFDLTDGARTDRVDYPTPSSTYEISESGYPVT